MNATPAKFQPLRSPEPRRPFVDRERELKLIQDKLDIGIQGKPMPADVICFWGAFGMGKSWLLLELERRHRQADSHAPSSHPTIAARLDLNQAILPALWQGGRLNSEQLIRELWKQLADQLPGASVPDLGRASPDAWAEAFVNQVTRWSALSVTPIIMLDTVDDLVAQDEKTFLWLEEHLVERLAITDRVLFVFASRGELRRWRHFQVRRRVDSHRLTAFDIETVGEAVKANPDISQALYHAGWGHPLVSERLGTALEDQGISLLQSTREAEQLLDPQVVQAVLREVTGEMLKTMPESSAKLARHASVLRWVSVEPLRCLAEKLSLAEPRRGDAYYLNLIEGLQAHHLLYWNSTENSYAFDPVLRRLLAHFLELGAPAQFAAAHNAAFTFHDGHLRQFPEYLARYLPELAYHRAILAQCELSGPLPPPLRTWWEEFLARKVPPHPEPWSELVKALEQDEELQRLLSPGDYKYLYSEAKQRAA
jgi:hypothetical protein